MVLLTHRLPPPTWLTHPAPLAQAAPASGTSLPPHRQKQLGLPLVCSAIQSDTPGVTYGNHRERSANARRCATDSCGSPSLVQPEVSSERGLRAVNSVKREQSSLPGTAPTAFKGDASDGGTYARTATASLTPETGGDGGGGKGSGSGSGSGKAASDGSGGDDGGSGAATASLTPETGGDGGGGKGSGSGSGSGKAASDGSGGDDGGSGGARGGGGGAGDGPPQRPWVENLMLLPLAAAAALGVRWAHLRRAARAGASGGAAQAETVNRSGPISSARTAIWFITSTQHHSCR